jgi:hypothetical protein
MKGLIKLLVCLAFLCSCGGKVIIEPPIPLGVYDVDITYVQSDWFIPAGTVSQTEWELDFTDRYVIRIVEAEDQEFECWYEETKLVCDHHQDMDVDPDDECYSYNHIGFAIEPTEEGFKGEGHSVLHICGLVTLGESVTLKGIKQ